MNNYRLLRNYVAQILCVPVVRETVNIDHTKHGYYSIKVLNPTASSPSALTRQTFCAAMAAPLGGLSRAVQVAVTM